MSAAWPVTRAAAGLALSVLASCATFVSVRPAQVVPGDKLTFQASVSAPPGELPAWMWSLYCAVGCNSPVAGVDIGYGHGVSDSTGAWYVEGGISSPLKPYLEMYRQFGDRARPQGFGARVGAPVIGSGMYRVFYRIDPRPDLTANTHLVVATVRSPNGENTATFVALIQSVGLMKNGATSGFIPAFSFGITHTLRNRSGVLEDAVGLLALVSFLGRSR